MTTHERKTLHAVTFYVAVTLWLIVTGGATAYFLATDTDEFSRMFTVGFITVPTGALAGILLAMARSQFHAAVERDGIALATTKAGANGAYFGGVVALCLVLDPAGAFFSGQYGKCLAVVAAVAVLAVVVRLIYAAIARAIIRRRGGGGGAGGTQGPTAPPAHDPDAESDAAQERAMLTSDAEVPAFVAAQLAALGPRWVVRSGGRKRLLPVGHPKTNRMVALAYLDDSDGEAVVALGADWVGGLACSRFAACALLTGEIVGWGDTAAEAAANAEAWADTPPPAAAATPSRLALQAPSVAHVAGVGRVLLMDEAWLILRDAAAPAAPSEPVAGDGFTMRQDSFADELMHRHRENFYENFDTSRHCADQDNTGGYDSGSSDTSCAPDTTSSAGGE